MQPNNFKETEIGLIPEDWDLLTIGESMEKIIDYRGKTPKKQDKGIPLITAKIVKNGRIKEPTEFIAEEDYDEWMRRGMPKSGDILITTEAPLGEVAQLDNRKVALAQRLITLRGKKGLVDNNFLKFILQSSFAQYGIESRGTGTTVIGIRQKELKKVLLPIPPFEEQLKIAHILLSIDKKIYLNHQMNQTLEEIGQSIFRHWFVHFEFPNSEGQPYKSSGGEMVDSELGEIPVGWRVGKIRDLVIRSKDTVNPSSNPDKLFNHHSIPSYDSGKTPIKEPGNLINSQKFVVKKNSILVSKLNPDIPRIWGVMSADEKSSVCSTEFQVLVPNNNNYAFVYYLFHSNNVKETMIALVTGTSKSHQRIRPEDILNIEILIPPRDILLKFEDLFKQFNALNEININQSQFLSKIRNSLLPKLMSGKIRVCSQEEATSK